MWRKWIIHYAVALHLLWGGLVLVDSSAMNVSALSWMKRLIPWPWVCGVGLLLVGGVAMAGMWKRDQRHALLLMLPQQFVLMASAFGAIECMLRSKFADGVPRPMAFIMADQLPAVLAAVFHTCALVEGACRTSLGASIFRR